MQSGNPAPKPLPSASILLIRDGTDGLEVFMVERHKNSSAFAGALVFPGGVCEPQDGLEPATPPFGLPLKLAAIRELFEETTLLLAQAEPGARTVDIDRAAQLAARHMAALRNGTLGLSELLAAENLTPATDALIPFTRWITPENPKKRFDTSFFLAAASEGHLGSHDGYEVVASQWIRPKDALAAAAAGRAHIVFPTRANLALLGQSATVAEALAAASARDLSPSEGHIVETPAGRMLEVGPQQGYPLVRMPLAETLRRDAL